MTSQPAKRKLSAIFSADVKGYSRLMEDDDEATVATLTAYRQVLSEAIEKHRGRVVDSPGDNVLAEFASVVDAVRGAVEIQEELKVRNATLPDHRRMEFRIGINLGDVLEEESRIYGDGVNIAARVEGLAEGGGVCISGAAYEQIKNKLSFGIEYLGEHTVKNISEPVPVYRLVLDPRTSVPWAEGRATAGRQGWRWGALAAAIAFLGGAGGLGIWKIAFRTTPATERSASDQTGPLEWLDSPTLAVLPFTNMSGDPGLESLSDGMTEQIITTLSKIPELSVAARNSAFTYKGKPVNVAQVGRELGVRYVLEGSVQSSDGQIRVTAQLLDASTGHHLWSERYDRILEDVFTVQDDVALKIHWSVQRKLTAGEQARIFEGGTDKLAAAEQCIEGFQYLSQCTKEGNVLAQEGFAKAVATDPGYAAPYMWLAYSHLMDAWYGWSDSSAESIRKAEDLLQKAEELAATRRTNRPAMAAISGLIHILRGEYDEAVAQAERAMKLNPNAATAHVLAAKIFNYAGRPEDGVATAKKAIELDPLPSSDYFVSFGDAYRLTGQFQEAVDAYRKALHRVPDLLPAHIGLAAAYGSQGRLDEARKAAAEVLRIDPRFSLETFTLALPYKNPKDAETTLEALRSAGLE